LRSNTGIITCERREENDLDFTDDLLQTVYTLSKSRYYVAPPQALEEISERAKV